MKRFSKWLVFVSIFSIVASCTQSSDVISEKLILAQFNNELHLRANDAYYVPINIGKFDCQNDSERYQLRQMAAAKLVTYDVSRYVWWEYYYEMVRESYQVQRRFWGYNYTDTEYRNVKKDHYNFEDHYVVDVELTKKGEKLVVNELPVPIATIDEDLIDPNVDPLDYSWNKVDLSEAWPTVENPFIVSEKKKKIVTEPVKSREQEKTKNKPLNVDIECIDSLQYDQFNKLILSSERVYLEAYECKGIKARNIQIYDVDGLRRARAEVIVSCYNVTDVGRIYYGVEDGKRMLANVKLEYYQDRGWVLKSYSMDDNEYAYIDDTDDDER